MLCSKQRLVSHRNAWFASPHKQISSQWVQQPALCHLPHQRQQCRHDQDVPAVHGKETVQFSYVVQYVNARAREENKLRTYPQQLDNSSASFHFSHICQPSGTSPRYLHQNLLHRNLTGTSPTYLYHNLLRLYLLHRNLPEPNLSICTRTFCTLRNLARNLVLKLHRIAPELIWAKDPIAKCCCWGKTIIWANGRTISIFKK